MSELTLAERIAAMIEAEKPAPAPSSEPESRPLAYSLKGAARATGLGEHTIRREVRAGRLKATKIRRRLVVTDEELRRYLAEHTDA